MVGQVDSFLPFLSLNSNFAQKFLCLPVKVNTHISSTLGYGGSLKDYILQSPLILFCPHELACMYMFETTAKGNPTSDA